MITDTFNRYQNHVFTFLYIKILDRVKAFNMSLNSWKTHFGPQISFLIFYMAINQKLNFIWIEKMCRFFYGIMWHMDAHHLFYFSVIQNQAIYISIPYLLAWARNRLCTDSFSFGQSEEEIPCILHVLHVTTKYITVHILPHVCLQLFFGVDSWILYQGAIYFKLFDGWPAGQIVCLSTYRSDRFTPLLRGYLFFVFLVFCRHWNT